MRDIDMGILSVRNAPVLDEKGLTFVVVCSPYDGSPIILVLGISNFAKFLQRR